MFTVLKVIRELKVHQQQSEDLHFTRFWHFFCSRHIFKLLIKHAIANSPCYHYYNMINMMWTQGKRHLCIWDGLVRAAHRGVALEGAATWGNHLAGPLSLSVCPTFAFSFGRGIAFKDNILGPDFLKAIVYSPTVRIAIENHDFALDHSILLRSAILDSQSMWLFH